MYFQKVTRFRKFQNSMEFYTLPHQVADWLDDVAICGYYRGERTSTLSSLTSMENASHSRILGEFTDWADMFATPEDDGSENSTEEQP